MGDTWFDGYSGQTTSELLALAGDYRIDSLVLAFEEALDRRSMTSELTPQERLVLAIEALEREVNNGGYAQFFANSSNEYVDVVAEALDSIGCVGTASITRQALDALGVDAPTAEAVADAIDSADDDVQEALSSCDAHYFASGEAIADRLFEWIGANQEAISLGGVEQALPADVSKRLPWWKRVSGR
jgi:hypothetical protein